MPWTYSVQCIRWSFCPSLSGISLLQMKYILFAGENTNWYRRLLQKTQQKSEIILQRKSTRQKPVWSPKPGKRGPVTCENNITIQGEKFFREKLSLFLVYWSENKFAWSEKSLVIFLNTRVIKNRAIPITYEVSITMLPVSRRAGKSASIYIII